MYDVKCPYCDADQEINHDDGYGYAEGIKYEQECGKCNKTFVYQTSIRFYYEAEKADCLNDGEHTFVPTKTFPAFYTKMYCTICGKERNPTSEEKKEHKIPTYEEYLKEIDAHQKQM